jgi:uncharacterized membrane protein
LNIKFKTIFTISFILVSVLFVGWNFDLNAKNYDNKMNNNTISRTNNRFIDDDFDWKSIEVISEPIFGKNFNIGNSDSPAIAVENGSIYVVWQDNNNTNGASSGDSDIFFKFFNGNQWSKIQVISEPIFNQNFNSGYSYYPDIAVENGSIYVVWHNNNLGDNDIFFRCNLTGKKWEDIQIISEPISGQNLNIEESRGPSIAVENGLIYVVWYDKNNTNSANLDWDIFYRCNFTGTSWEDIQVISEPIPNMDTNIGYSNNPDIAVENGKIHVVWSDSNNTNSADVDSDIFYRCNVTGNSWESIQVISEPIQGKNFSTGFSLNPAIAIENGKIHVVWSDNNNTNNANVDGDIFYRCKLTGTSWESIQVISEPSFGKNFNTGGSNNPEIAIENDKIFVIWSDNNNTKNSGLDYDILFRYNFSGFAWESIQVISEPIFYGDSNVGFSSLPHIAINQGKNHLVWRDSNLTNSAGSDEDIFYRSLLLTVGLHSPKVTPTFGNTNTNFNFTITYFHLDNKPPSKITVNISGIEYSMLEVDQSDIIINDGKDYFFNIKNLDIGIHTYQFDAFYDLNIISSKLYHKPIVNNTIPNIITKNNLTAFEDVYYEVQYEYNDIDIINVGQPPCYWNFSTNGNWLGFNYTTATLYGTPTNDDVGEYWINISVNDTMNTNNTNFTLLVINVNDKPIIIINDNMIAYEDDLYVVDYNAIDVDNPQDDLIWKMNTNARWLRFETTMALLNGTPLNDDVGEYWVNISVNDSEYLDYSNFTLKVLNVNDPPKIITENNFTAFENEYYEVIYKAKDVDNTQSELVWDINTNAQWLTSDILPAIINGTPTNDDVGEYWINITLSDNEFIDYTNFSLTVVNINDPPIIITEDKTNVTVGEFYSINYEAKDIDPVSTTFSWSMKTNVSDWLSIDPITGWLIGVPTERDVGLFWINISVTDGENGWDHHNFILKVKQLPTKNIAPSLSNASITPLKGNINTVFKFSVHYYDTDNDVPSFIRVVINDDVYEMSLKLGENASNGIYEYRTNLSEGRYIYYYTASDGLDTTKTNNFNTPEIKRIEEVSKERTFWYLLILVLIFIIIIIVLVMSFFIYKKRKAAEIPTVRAELIHAQPEHIVLPSAVSVVEGVKPLPHQHIILDQLPTPKVQAQPAAQTTSEILPTPTPTLAPTPLSTEFQLPQATLSKAQQLHLLKERLLKSEIVEETYNKLRAEIEGNPDKDIIDIEKDLEKQSGIDEQNKSKSIEESIKLYENINDTPKNIDKPFQQLNIEPRSPQSQTSKYDEHKMVEIQTKQLPMESSPISMVNTNHQQEPSSPVHQHLKSIDNEETDEK